MAEAAAISGSRSKNRTIVITGFGEFAGVSDNPSKAIVEQLQAENFQLSPTSTANASDSADDVIINWNIIYDTLEVSVDGCSEFHKNISATITATTTSSAATAAADVVYVHLGVYSGSRCIRLEQCAFNNCDFRCPDQRGFCPQQRAINSAAALDAPLHSALPLEAICQHLNSTFPTTSTYNGDTAIAAFVDIDAVDNSNINSNINSSDNSNINSNSNSSSDNSNINSSNGKLVMVTHDPGRFLCNFIYYQALQHQRSLGAAQQSLFVHIPDFNAVAATVQIAIVKELLRCIAKTTL